MPIEQQAGNGVAAQLPAGQELLREVLRGATKAAVVYDAENDAVIANPRALELHGMPPASAPLERWDAYYDARWPDGTKARARDLPLARAIRGERVPAVRLTFNPRLGDSRTVDARADPLFDQDERLIGAIAIFRDVDGSDRAEEALRLRSAVTANMAEGVILIRAADRQIVYVNDPVERMFGYEPGEMVGSNIAMINAPTALSPHDVAADIESALRADGEWHGEIENVRKDGTRIWCRANVSGFDHPEHGLVWIAVHTDVTDRREAERALRLAEERFRKVFEEGPLGIVMFSEDLTITDGNEACCRITGYSREQLIGRSIGDVTHPADAVLDLERARRVFLGEIPSYRAEKRCVTADGATVWVAFTATMVRDDAGNPLYGLGILEDINERKRIEALMIRQNKRLATDLESSLSELRLSRARIIASADLERRRIERDLHDGAQQRLVALRVRLGLAQDLLRDDPVRGGAMLSELGADVDAALEEVRLLARGVYPSVLADRGLVAYGGRPTSRVT